MVNWIVDEILNERLYDTGFPTIAKAEWQADTVYICDVALRPDDTAKVVELNAFSSSGLYACDTRMVVEAVSHAAIKEWQGELEDQ